MQKTLKAFQKRLANLSSQNRSLLLLKCRDRFHMDVHLMDYLQNRPSFAILSDLLKGKKNIPLCSHIDARLRSSNEVSLLLKNIYRTDKNIQEESGARDLQIGYPFVEGALHDGTPVRCPLLFFPVELSYVNNEWCIGLRENETISFNKTFLLAYAHYNGVLFEDTFLDESFESFGEDPLAFLTKLYHLLEKSPVELHFNPEQFARQLQFFATHQRKDFDLMVKPGMLRMTPNAVLGIFPQANSYLSPDYDRLIHDNSLPDLESFFTSRALTSDESLLIAEENILHPYAMDASQEHVLREIKKGKSLVVQGPPGTGKSQILCNIMADAMASGKKVLLVCQKRAALDVVYARLKEKQLHQFAALVHDFRNDRSEIFRKIEAQIEDIDKFQKENQSIDALFVERQFLQRSRSVDTLQKELEDLRTALFDRSICGLNVRELYLSSNPEKPHIPLEEEVENFHFDTYQDFCSKFKRYMEYAQRLETEGYPFNDRVSFASFNAKDLYEIERCMSEVADFKSDFLQKASSIFKQQISIAQAERWIDELPEIKSLAKETINSVHFSYIKHTLKYQRIDPSSLDQAEKIILESFDGIGFERSLRIEQLSDIQELLHSYENAHRSLFHKWKWKIFNGAQQKKVLEILASNQLEETMESVHTLLTKIDNRLHIEHHLSHLLATEWVIGVPSDFKKESFESWFSTTRKVLEVRSRWMHFRDFFSGIDITLLEIPKIESYLSESDSILNEFTEREKKWNTYLTTKQIRKIWEGSHIKDKFSKALREDFENLCAFDALKNEFLEGELKVVRQLKEHYGYFELYKSMQLFENSLRLAYIEKIEKEYPILRTVSSLQMDQRIRELNEHIADKEELCTQITQMKGREQTYTRLQYNRLNNRVTYRDLLHQVKKKRNVFPLRKLISLFSHELFDLLPCWLCSPESASALFPLEQSFDLVLFDEASQCFAERGIPALYRGKQIVIVGDDQQLPPFDLYTPRWEELLQEDEIHTELEIDSLLDLGKQYLPQVVLQGHYRSHSLELIEFSNQHFYEGRLEMIPFYEEYHRKDAAIQYIRVDGVQHQSTNHAEALEVVRIIKSLLQSGEKNIGVITFNYPQQQLIQDTLELMEMNVPSELFVKNLENVQGDERDIIIFSTVYAPDSQGKMYLRFGSLNAPKGENRLNVAISRARKNIFIVSSLYPHELKVEETKNQGPKLLKAYLEYAYEVSSNKRKAVLSQKKEIKPSTDLLYYLKKTLSEEEQLKIDETIPFADMAFLDTPTRINHLILTDGESLRTSLSAKDFFSHRVRRLENTHWPSSIFYSRNFWLKPSSESIRLKSLGKNAEKSIN